MSTDSISEFFDREACCRSGRPRKAKGLSGASMALLEGLEVAGYNHRSVLELGCGLGNLSLELVSRGASRVTGIDLSERSIGVARERARASGHADRAAFSVGDAAAAALSPHDVVVLDKVICCYPDVSGLVCNSLSVAGSVFAFSLPASSGLRGTIARGGIAVENAWRRIRSDPFRAYVHDMKRIDARVRAEGFARVGPTGRWMWATFIYTR
ncbi:MAG: class I SAM-dependent methyltransferase [Actinomycetota bacterium]